MTPMQKVDLATFVVVAVACAWDCWRAGRYPRDEARRVRLRAAGIALWVSVLPAGVFLSHAFNLGAWALLMAVLAGGGGDPVLLVISKGLAFGSCREECPTSPLDRT